MLDTDPNAPEAMKSAQLEHRSVDPARDHPSPPRHVHERAEHELTR